MSNMMDVYAKIIEQDINNIPDSSPYKASMIEGLKSIQLFESEKLKNNRVKNVLSVRLMADSYESGQIGLKPLTEVLTSLENIQKNGLASISGYSGKRGKIPKDILSKNELIITATRAGSFVVDLAMKENQLSIFEEENHPANKIMEDVTDFLQNKIEIADFVDKYNPRTFGSVKKLISNLNSEGIGFEIIDDIKKQTASFPREKVKEINTELKSTYIEKREGMNIIGKLTKVDLGTQKITLDTDSGAITIKVNDEKIKDYRLTTNDVYEITTNVRELVRKGQRTQTYSTNSIDKITKK